MTEEELAEVLKAVHAHRPQVTQTFNFHAPVGQQIAHVERMEVHFDKEMQMQVGNVEEMCREAPTETPSRKGPRFSQKTFKAKVGNSRLEKLYWALQKAKMVSNDTTPKAVADFFGGQISDCLIRWMGPEATLAYFIKELMRKGYAEPVDDEPWIIVRNHFRNKDNEDIDEDIRKCKEPKKQKTSLDGLVELLNPTATGWDEMANDEFEERIDLLYDGQRIRNRLH